MPISVRRISGFTNKSWTTSSNLDEIEFEEKNIIFGHNGAGKSSLKKRILEEHTKTGSTDSLRVFDSNYVKEALLLEDGSGIRGVVSNFGKKDVEIEKKVKANNERIKVVEEEIVELKNSISESTNDIDSLIKETVKRRKGDKRIKNKPEGPIDKHVQFWIDDYDEARRQFPNEDLSKITGNIDMTEEHDRINDVFIPDMPALPNNLSDMISKILTIEYKTVNIPSSDIVEWLESGLHIHDNADTCQFCGGSIDINVISERVNSYLNNEKHKATIEIKECRDLLIKLRETVTKLSENKERYVKTIDTGADMKKFDNLSVSSSYISATVKTIDRKLNDMGLAPEFDAVAISDSIEYTKRMIADLEEKKKRAIENVMTKINKVEILIKGAIGFEIMNSEFIKTKLKDIEDGHVREAELVAECERIAGENRVLLSKKSDLADFAEYLNGILEEQGFNFKLQLDGNVYIIVHSNGTPLGIEDISDGERNLLALIHFYYEMLIDPSHTIKDAIKLIVIDDPISSLDDGNKFYITTLIRSILGCDTSQIFVFTHSWDDFCNISYGYHDKASLLEIRKTIGVSNIYHFTKKLLKPYKLLYRGIYDFSEKDISTVSDEALYIPNTMRRVVEEYVKFKVDVDLATPAAIGEISKALFREEYNKISRTKQQRLEQMLSICNILSHRSTHPKDPSEVHRAAKFLMNTINDNDKYHHMKMIG
jgi:wobble nucleotide-excising tRNase